MAPVSLTPVANLPPVSTILASVGQSIVNPLHIIRTLAKLVEIFAAGVVDTGGNFAAGVVDTGGNFATGVGDTSGAP